jgi:hypothetical protein
VFTDVSGILNLLILFELSELKYYTTNFIQNKGFGACIYDLERSERFEKNHSMERNVVYKAGEIHFLKK